MGGLAPNLGGFLSIRSRPIGVKGGVSGMMYSLNGSTCSHSPLFLEKEGLINAPL